MAGQKRNQSASPEDPNPHKVARSKFTKEDLCGSENAWLQMLMLLIP